MYQLLYVSSACQEMDDQALSAILERARVNNARDGISGMLLYIDGNFLQVLEGEQAMVEATFARISQDERHKDITPLLRRNVAERCFSDWSMGFDRLDGRDCGTHQHIFQISSDAVGGRVCAEAPREIMMFLENFLRINPGAMRARA